MPGPIAPCPIAFIEDISVTGFHTVEDLFARLVAEVERPEQSVVSYLNVHVANVAHRDRKLKRFLQGVDLVYCDGAGIEKAASLLGSPLPKRLTAADWFLDLIQVLSQKGIRIYLLGGEPAVAQKAREVINAVIPEHMVVGIHHGYILDNPILTHTVIQEINTLQPDLLIVGFGTPLQERWIADHREQLTVSVIYAIGAVMDYLAEKVPRCPAWMGEAGLEWLFRLRTEPRRLFMRYVVGNPWFLSRIALTALSDKVKRIRFKDRV